MKNDSLLWWGGTLLFVIITFIPSIFIIYPFLIWLIGDSFSVWVTAFVIAIFLFIGFIVGFILRKNRQVKLIERIFRALFLASFFVLLYGSIRYFDRWKAHGNCIYDHPQALYNKIGIKVKEDKGEIFSWLGYNEYDEPVFIYANEKESSRQKTTDCYIGDNGERDYSRKVKVIQCDETYDISFYDSYGRFIEQKKSFCITYYESPDNNYKWEYYTSRNHDSNKWSLLGKEICDYKDYSLK